MWHCLHSYLISLQTLPTLYIIKLKAMEVTLEGSVELYRKKKKCISKIFLHRNLRCNILTLLGASHRSCVIWSSELPKSWSHFLIWPYSPYPLHIHGLWRCSHGNLKYWVSIFKRPQTENLRTRPDLIFTHTFKTTNNQEQGGRTDLSVISWLLVTSCGFLCFNFPFISAITKSYILLINVSVLCLIPKRSWSGQENRALKIALSESSIMVDLILSDFSWRPSPCLPKLSSATPGLKLDQA